MKFDFMKNQSLRIVIIVVITAVIALFAILIGFLSYSSGMRAVKESAKQSSVLASREMTKMLNDYLSEPYVMEEFHKNAILSKTVNLNDEKQRDRNFVEMLKLFPRVANSYIALADGSEYGANRAADGGFVVWQSDIEKKKLNYYRYDALGGRAEYTHSLFSYDTRERPPYLRGMALHKAGWTDIYPSATGRGLVVTAVSPIYDERNQLTGVLGSSLLLHWMNEYLMSIKVTDNSTIYIIGRNGELIAASQASDIKAIAEANTMIYAENAEDFVLAESMKQLKKQVDSLESLKEDRQISFKVNGETFLLYVHPIHEENGLDWLSLIVIPQADLTYCLSNFTRQLIFLVSIVCLLGLLAGFLTSRHIVNPLIKVNAAARQIAEGNFSTQIQVQRKDEIGQLIVAVNDMAVKLKDSFAKLQRNKLRIKLLTAGLETSSNIVLILGANRHVWWASASFEHLSGYKIAEIFHKDIAMLLSAANGPEVLAEVKEHLMLKREWKGEIIGRSKEGNDYIDEISITPIFDDLGEVFYFLIVGQDITEKVKARQAMIAAQKAQVKAEKMSSLGVMAAGISHEINQPLNAIKVLSGGILYLLKQDDAVEPAEFSHAMQEISDQTDRISHIIKHLRSFIQQDDKILVPCAMHTAVDLALEMVGTRLRTHNIQVQKEFAKNLPLVLGTVMGLAEVIVNLLVNAMQALDTVHKKGKEIVIKSYFSEQVILEIIDNGPGIMPGMESQIFESFISTKAQGDNLGLGLAIVNTIITAYGGETEAAGNSAGGATFTVRLPAVKNKDEGDIQ